MTKKIISQCALCILSATTGLHAIPWSAAVDGDWNTPASWTGGVVPTASDEAKINKAANVTVSTAAEANYLLTGLDSTLTVTSDGSLTVTTDADVGNLGTDAYGAVVVDGGTLTIRNKLFLGKYDDTRSGSIQLNSGVISVGDNTLAPKTNGDLAYTSKVVQIGGNNLGTGVVDMAGGNFTVYGQFWVGSAGEGTLNLSGGTLDISAGDWQNLRIGHQAGNGTVNMTGGTLVTKGIVMDNNTAGNANINLDGGTLEVIGGFTNALKMSDNSDLAIGDGVLQWEGDRRTDIDTLITNGNITFANPTTSGNYPDVTPEQSWAAASGATTLYADTNEVRSGYTTVWAESNDTDGDGYNNSVDAFPDDPDEWADSDGDNVGDNADVHDGYNDAALDAYLSANGYSTGGGAITQEAYDAAVAAKATAETALANAREARPGSTVIDVANDLADITLRVEQTSDVSDWSSATTSDHTIQLSAPAGASFYRFTIPE